MKLQRFQVQKFRNIIDSSMINVEPDVTCLVGMNEAGKSAILTALARLNPARADAFNVSEDYPRWLKSKDTKSGVLQDVEPIKAIFALEATDRQKVEDIFGAGVLTSDEVTMSRKYDDAITYWLIGLDEGRAVKNLIAKMKIAGSAGTTLKASETFADLKTAATQVKSDLASTAEASINTDAVARLLSAIEGFQVENGLLQAITRVLKTPKFFYFGEYSILKGRIDLGELAMSEEEEVASSPNQTARALLALANTTAESLGEEDYEERKAELESVSVELTNEVFTYWKQNEHLRVTFDLDLKIGTDAYNRVQVSKKILQIRVEDRRHNFTNNFSQRSSGFRWFFSFLAAFNEFENRNDDFIVLLDEPALTLHGRAQGDFLTFINKRLAVATQVLYTTHSPFMVESDHLNRVRIVEDKGPGQGATVTQEILSVNKDSLFPLQGALGYDIAQHLFIGNDNLLIEGPSDLLYIDITGRLNIARKKTVLHSKWRMLPAGGASNLPAFVTLLGGKLSVTVLIDSGTEGTGRLHAAMAAGHLKQNRLVSVQEITGRPNSDIEDLFTETDYLRLYNAAFGTSYKPADLPPGDRIVERLKRLRGSGFDHYKPADRLLRDPGLQDALGNESLDNFARLAASINKTRTR